MKADRAEISWDQQSNKWLIRIQVGEEIIRRHTAESKDADQATLHHAALQLASDEGYTLDPSNIVFSGDKTNLLQRLYNWFNARDMENLLAAMHPDVVWANGMEGGHVHGRAGVRDYWTRQWAIINPHVEPVSFPPGVGSEVLVEVHQVVHDLDGNLLGDHLVHHSFQIDDGLITRFDIQEPAKPVPSN